MFRKMGRSASRSASRSFSVNKLKSNALDLRFRYDWTGLVMVPLAVLQLLMYLSAPKEHGVLIGMFAATYLLVSNYTRDAEYKLGIPMLLTFVIARYDILKQNAWEGLSNKDDAKKHKGDAEEQEDEEDEEEGGDAEEGAEGGGDADGDAEGQEDGEDDGASKAHEENFANKSAPSDVDLNDTSALMNDTLSNLDNTLGRIENSYDRIMKIGSKLGINNQLNTLAKSIDITGILNQQKELK